MNCRKVRDLLGAAVVAPRSAELDRHLAGCPDCARLAARWQAAGRLLATGGLAAEPDAGFTARVLARLPDPPDAMGWAAVRLLPVTLALALVLSAWCLVAVPGPSSLLDETPVDDPLAWSVASSEAGS